MKWLIDITTIEELRNQYKKLLITHHPDNNPDIDTTRVMQEINAEYDALLKQFAANQSSDSKFSTEKEMELKRVLNEAVKIKADILIELVGTWIWVSGNTYSVKSRLKELGFKWASKKHMWYWGTSEHKYTFPLEMEDIRAKYGSIVYHRHTDISIGIK